MRLVMVIYSMIATAMGGTGVIAVTLAGYASFWPMILGAAAGAIVALLVAGTAVKKIE